jgi:hypothetical protein
MATPEITSSLRSLQKWKEIGRRENDEETGDE